MPLAPGRAVLSSTGPGASGWAWLVVKGAGVDPGLVGVVVAGVELKLGSEGGAALDALAGL